MSSSCNIGGEHIGNMHPPFIIAELSGNHNQSLNRALKIVDAAADAGANAIKLQTYTPDTITLNNDGNDFQIKDEKSLWKGKSLYELYSEASTPWSWHEKIFEYAKSRGLLSFSSPFDESAVDFLETLNVPAYKIASFENNHLPLIEKAAFTGKPLIISTGLASLSALDDAVKTARNAGCNDLILLKCTSSYPASPSKTNIKTIPHLKQLFKTEVGLSDHTKGIGVAVASVALGATVIEKHLTLDRSEGGVDSAFSLEPKELKNLVIETNNAWKSLGEITYGATDEERNNSAFKRSIYTSKDIKNGDNFSAENIKVVRPGFGADPKYYNLILGKKAKKDYKEGTALTLDMII